MTIAIDFDGTIVKHRYPKIGQELPFATDTLKLLIQERHRLILWSVREGELLEEAVEWCRQRGVEFYAVNKDYPEEREVHTGFSRKIKADLFIDDRNLGGLPDWGTIYRMIQEQRPHQLMDAEKKEKGAKKGWIRKFFLSLCLLLFCCTSKAQQVDFLLGAELLYSDVRFTKMYEVVANLNPAVKWDMGRNWMLAAQVTVPVYNDYGGRYKKIRPTMAVLSKELSIADKSFFKVSGGLFSHERYGLDVKWMHPLSSWLALEAQANVTGFCSMAVDWECSTMQRLSGVAGLSVYLEKVNTQIRMQAGRFLYKDYGVMGECMRHFKHCTVGVYAQYTDKGKENGGFKVIMMLPPYHRKAKKWNIRPASNFRLTYNMNSSAFGAKMVQTDPEENEQEGHFRMTKGGKR